MNHKKILVVDDEKLIRWSLVQKFSQWDYDTAVAETGNAALKAFDSENPDLVLLDINLPDIEGTEVLKELKQRRPEIPIIMITAYGSIEDAVSAMRMGAYDFITKPIDDLKIQGTIKNALETATLKQEVAFYKEQERKQFELDNIIAESEAMKKILEMTEVIAQSETTIVLLQGESGTGKDLLAQSIHHMSRRQGNPFLAINCSAIPENLLESELFGYEKGAFTDAKQRKKGLAELANEGTLFLDEISTLSLPVQAKLLRFLETQTLRRVGGLEDIEVDLRVIAATNRDLEAAVAAGRFREDLYYRLKVVTLSLPTLRERPGDIPGLTEYFLQRFSQEMGIDNPGVSKSALTILKSHHWPGNVRELANTIQKALIFSKGGPLDKQDIIRLTDDVPHNRQTVDADQAMPFEGMLNQWIHQKMLTSKEDNLFESLMDFFAGSVTREALSITGGNRSQASKLLGLSRPTLLAKIDKYGLKIHTDVTR